jgi:Uma2 family endonuclease
MTQQLRVPELTYEEFMALQDSCHDGTSEFRGYELDEGELQPMTALDPWQSHAQMHFGRQLANYVESRSLGEVFPDCFLDLGRRRWHFPDFTFLSHEDMARFDGHRLPVPPTLVVEVAVKSSEERDTVRKKAVYHQAGVPWYWIVNLVSRQIEEFRHRPEAYELLQTVGLYEPFQPALFPDLTIQLTPLIPPAS